MARIEPTCRASGYAPTLVPNDETVKAIEAARRGELITVGDVDGLMAYQNEDDQPLRTMERLS